MLALSVSFSCVYAIVTDITPVVLNLFHPMHPFSHYSQIKPPLTNLVSKEHYYISTLRRETKLFTIDKLNYITF